MNSHVCIIGGGLAGLSAGQRILEQSASAVHVTLLEASGRYGGRTQSVSLATHPCCFVDLGGQWVGPRQTAALNLIKELELKLQPQFAKGLKTLHMRDAIKVYTGLVPNASITVLLDAQLMLWILAFIQILVRYSTWAARWSDKWSVGQLTKFMCTNGGRILVKIVVQALIGLEPEEVSLLAFARYISASGGLEPMTETGPGSLQAWTVQGGAGQLSAKILKKLSSNTRATMLLRKHVVEVRANSNTAGEPPVTVVCSDGTVVQCDHVVFAVPPPTLASVSCQPSFSNERTVLNQRAAMGTIIKSIVVYKRAFWREAGHSGEVICDTMHDENRAAFNVFDNSLPSTTDSPAVSSIEACGGVHVSSTVDGPGLVPMLVVFINGQKARTYSALSPVDRKAAVMSQLVQWFGKEAAEPVEYIEKDWTTEPFTRGCPISSFAPGVLSAFGLSRHLRQPEWRVAIPSSVESIHRLHFAGTETSDVSTGFMDGAIRSGYSAAAEVAHDLALESKLTARQRQALRIIGAHDADIAMPAAGGKQVPLLV